MEEDADNIIGKLEVLEAEIHNDRGIPQLVSDHKNEVESYNDELKLLGPVTWHDSPWLFTECYLFYRLHTIFSGSHTHFWQDFDVWSRCKSGALRDSRPAIAELAGWYFELEENLQVVKAESEKQKLLSEALEQLLEISLWGNAADLLSTMSSSLDELKTQKSAQARQRYKRNIVANDTGAVITALAAMKAQKARKRSIHIVLDNAGFELASDLIVAAVLLTLGYADEIVLHGKSFPWYVSDATLKDFEDTVDFLCSPQICPDKASNTDESYLHLFGAELKHWLKSSPPKLFFVTHAFWTTAHPLARLPDEAPDLLQQLQGAALVIFKGDLNYRKLIAGGRWPPTTSFETAIGPVATLGFRIIALRTCKGDACVGLTKAQAYEVDPKKSGMWTRTGEYGVISFLDGCSSQLASS